MRHRVVMPHCHIRTLAQVHHAGERRQEAGGEDEKDITGLQLRSSMFGASRCGAAQSV